MFSPMFSGCLVGLSAGLNKSCLMDFHKTRIEDVSQPRKDPVNFREVDPGI